MCTPPKTPVVVEAPKDAVERRVTPPLKPRLRVTRGEETRMPTAHGDFDAVCAHVEASRAIVEDG